MDKKTLESLAAKNVEEPETVPVSARIPLSLKKRLEKKNINIGKTIQNFLARLGE